MIQADGMGGPHHSSPRGPSPQAVLSRTLAVVLVVLYAGSISYVMTRGKAVDFYLYYLAAYGFADGKDMYAIGATPELGGAAWAELARELRVPAYAPPYRYPPLTAVLVWPLTWLPPRGAAAAWLAASGVALIGSALLLGCAGETALGVPLALGLLLGFVPPLVTLYAGQANAFVLLALAVAFHACAHRRPALAGAAVAVGAMLKLVPFAHLGYFAWRRQWRAAVAGLFVLVACAGVSLPLIGWHGLTSYARHFRVLSGSTYLSAAAGNQALSGLFARFLVAEANPWHWAAAPGLAWWLTWGASAGLIAATAVFCWPAGKASRLWRLEFALVTTAVCVAAPYLWYHQLVLLLIPLFVLAEQAVAQSSLRWMLVPLGIGYVLTDVFGLAWRYLQRPVLASMPLFTALMIWGMLVWLLTRERRRCPMQTAYVRLKPEGLKTPSP